MRILNYATGSLGLGVFGIIEWYSRNLHVMVPMRLVNTCKLLKLLFAGEGVR